jgi:hypothetical protein
MDAKRLIIHQLLCKAIDDQGVIDDHVEVVDAIHRRAICAAYTFAPHYDRWAAAYEAAVCKQIRKLHERFSGIRAGSVSERMMEDNEAR